MQAPDQPPDELPASPTKLAALGGHVPYRARVELTGVHEFAKPITSDTVTACADLLADEGHQWIAFLERGSNEGLTEEMASLVRTCKQYVYLGAATIPAEHWQAQQDPARRR